MSDRDKVIKGLQCLLIKDGILWDSCENCHFGNTAEGCLHHICSDAITLLKAQEPRVMTLEEVRKWEQPDVWMEFRKDGTIEPTSRLGFTLFAAVVTNGTVNPPVTMIDGYGITWRCWTDKPSNEQRKAVEWNDPE